jgi:hypothetical protein
MQGIPQDWRCAGQSAPVRIARRRDDFSILVDDTNAKPFVSMLDTRNSAEVTRRSNAAWVRRDNDCSDRDRQLEGLSMKRFLVVFSVAALVSALAVACGGSSDSSSGSSGGTTTTSSSGSEASPAPASANPCAGGSMGAADGGAAM